MSDIIRKLFDRKEELEHRYVTQCNVLNKPWSVDMNYKDKVDEEDEAKLWMGYYHEDIQMVNNALKALPIQALAEATELEEELPF